MNEKTVELNRFVEYISKDGERGSSVELPGLGIFRKSDKLPYRCELLRHARCAECKRTQVIIERRMRSMETPRSEEVSAHKTT